MVKRLFDILLSAVAILTLSPVFVVAAIGIRLTSPGPVIYRARRTGRHGIVFIMHKFRTMHVATGTHCAITATCDPRVFPFGRLLRALKIDEFPQLFDVLTGHMSIVGPRPEDPRIVDEHYGPLGRETLTIAPGLASPGSLYNYTHSHLYLDDAAPESSYVSALLPMKLALELVYVRNVSLLFDLQIIFRTALTILQMGVGRTQFPEPPEMAEARMYLEVQGGLVTSEKCGESACGA